MDFIQEKKEKKSQAASYVNKYFKVASVLVAGLLVVGGLFLVLKPMYDEIVVMEAVDLTAVNDELTAKQMQLAKINKLVREYEKISENDIAKVNALLPEGVLVKEELYSMIQNIIIGDATSSNITIYSMNAETEEVSTKQVARSKRVEGSTEDEIPGEIVKTRLSLDLKGVDYFRLKKILEKIENNLRLMDVKTVDFNPQSNIVSLGIDTYYLDGSSK